ncbi:hypothetical protein [Streptomyces sp. NBC_01187]|uniref:hypothetical protein n=1 Tax=Streptomyces sp. NBC_01187 TaxID=2903766 RepID=UPI003870CAFB|nr:hypothetical protein OG220_26725 [Streptomyces sp. NBC_01187]
MCLSMAPAEFSGTTLFLGRRHHPEHGLVHVLGYQNTAVNLADGPNAMLLHLPAARMTRHNFLSVGRDSNVLDRMVDAVRPRSVASPDPIAWMGWGAAPEVEVFEHDIYTVLLAADPTALPAALSQVPAHKRPALDPELLRFYAERYPGCAMAVCCFDNAQAGRAKPLLMWYQPYDADLLTLPALDCHTGAPPDLEAEVPVDHWLLFGTDEAPEGWGAPVDYPYGMRHKLRAFLPDTVLGTHVEGSLPNGDFALSHRALLAGDLGRIERVREIPLAAG